MKKTIAIIGTGAYGTALANVLADKGHQVIMYGIVSSQVDDLNLNHENGQFFPGVKLNKNIKATTDLVACLENAQYIILGVPTKALSNVLDEINKYLKHEVVVINTAKGFDDQNVDLLSKMIVDKLKKSGYLKGYCGLYGPSIASEIVDRKPTFVNVASDQFELAEQIAEEFSNEYFFAKPSDDLPGCEVSAALKNVIAICAGMFDGMELGDNAHASLLCLGLNEIMIMAEQFGAKTDTFTNFATMGDLILTASTKKSRNFTFGKMIIETGSTTQAQERYGLTVEGVQSAEVAHKICLKYQISSPLFRSIYEIIYKNKNPHTLLNTLFVLY